MPVFGSLHTSIEFHPLKPNYIIIALLSNEFYVYDVNELRMTVFSTSQSPPTAWLENKSSINGIAFDYIRPNHFFLYGTNFICTVDMSKEMPAKDTKLQKMNADSLAMNFDSHRFSSIMYFGGISNEVVVVERPVLQVLNELPPAFVKPRYGT